MYDDDPIDEGPGKHDAHLMDDDLSETVICPRCGEHIWAYSQRCEHCGVHFQGEAWQYDAASDPSTPTGRIWPIIVALVIIAMLFWLIF